MAWIERRWQKATPLADEHTARSAKEKHLRAFEQMRARHTGEVPQESLDFIRWNAGAELTTISKISDNRERILRKESNNRKRIASQMRMAPIARAVRARQHMLIAEGCSHECTVTDVDGAPCGRHCDLPYDHGDGKIYHSHHRTYVDVDPGEHLCRQCIHRFYCCFAPDASDSETPDGFSS